MYYLQNTQPLLNIAETSATGDSLVARLCCGSQAELQQPMRAAVLHILETKPWSLE